MGPNRTAVVDLEQASEVVTRFQPEATKWLYGLDEAARILSWAFFTLIPYTDKLRQTKALRQPHLLFKGPTGTGKTDLVSACAMAVDAQVRAHPGPAHLYAGGHPRLRDDRRGARRQPRRIRFKPGKLMAHIVLIDEDNRLTAKTKAAMLEGMEESSATLTSDYGNIGESEDDPAVSAVVRSERHRTVRGSSWSSARRTSSARKKARFRTRLRSSIAPPWRST